MKQEMADARRSAVSPQYKESHVRLSGKTIQGFSDSRSVEAGCCPCGTAGRTSSPQQPRAPRSVTPTSHRRQDTPAAYRPSSYGTAKKQARTTRQLSDAPSNYAEQPRKKRRSIIPILLIIVGIGLIVAAAAIFINAQIGYKQASDSYQKIEKQYVSDKDASGVPIIDFDALAQTNPEIVGWIYVPGTNINYPVVQTNNNSKYLNTLFDGTSNASGAIFLDSDDTAPGMVDQQTTIYGHHMNDGSMFNVISDTTDQTTFDSIEFVYYITRDATYKLRPLATKVVEDTYAKRARPILRATTAQELPVRDARRCLCRGERCGRSRRSQPRS